MSNTLAQFVAFIVYVLVHFQPAYTYTLDGIYSFYVYLNKHREYS